VDLARGGSVAGHGQLDHVAHALADEVRGHRDHALGAERHHRERGPVVARVDLEVGRALGHDARGGLEVGGGVLDGHDVGDVGGQAEQGVGLDREGRPWPGML
jgi:hypothetical protein